MNTTHPLNPAQPRYGYQPADPAAPPAVSVVTPVFNTGSILLETAESLLRQSLQQWEWLVVNDGSTDGATLRALTLLREGADPRIRVLDTPNRGLPHARNAGVAATSAPLIFLLDSDDLLAPTALEKLAWTLHSHPASALAGAWAATFGAEQILWRRGFSSRHIFPHDNITNPLVMLRRAAFDQVGGFRQLEPRWSGLEDYELWTRMAAEGLWGHDVPEPLVWVRRKPLSSYTSYQWGFQRDPRAMPTLRDELRSRYPRLFRDGPPAPPGPSPFASHAIIPTALPFENRLAPVFANPALVGEGRGQRAEAPLPSALCPLPHAPHLRRVLLLLPWVRVGGSDRFALDVAAGLVERGDRASVALTRADMPHTWMAELLAITPDVFDLAAFLRPADFPRFLVYLIHSRGITHVWVSNSILGYQLLPFLRAHCPETVFVDYNHITQTQRDGGLPQAGVEHSELLDLHIASSAHLRAFMIERGAAPERVEVCTTNIDTTRWVPDRELRRRVRAELGIGETTPVILFAARLSAEKRAPLAATVLRTLRDDGVPFVALVAGDGEDRLWLKLFVARHRLGEQVRLLGAVPGKRVRELLAAASPTPLPSEREGIALVLFEALAMGVVPVASDVGGQSELVTPECGVLVPVGPAELEAYVAALRRLIVAPELREAMGVAGRARVLTHFTAEAMHERMAELLDHAAHLARHAPRPLVGKGVGLAAATLAIEHEQLERRLRALPPVKLALRLRHSGFARAAAPLRRVLGLLARLDRASYAMRREVMWRVKKLLRRPHNQ
jgi:glycosyltransferase involved in cell wall biosynthesis